jgi:hypothetical protein
MGFDLFQRATYYRLKAQQLRAMEKDAEVGQRDYARAAREYEKLAEQCEKVARAIGHDIP